jgi:hypothetical protein
MKIFIPTRDRVNAQFTWDNLHYLQDVATLVCPAEEVQAHLDHGRRAIARPPVPLAGVRQWLVDEAVNGPDQGRKPIIMLDDDLAFFVRKSPDAHNLTPAGDKVGVIMHRLYNMVYGTGTELGSFFPVHAGLSPRQGNNWAFPDKVQYTTRVNAVHCILPAALAHYGIRYDTMDMMEDYHVTLSLFEEGEDNAAITDAAWDQCKGSGAPGGFSHYRTSDRQTQAAEKLASLHPRSVKVVKKNPKTGSGGFAGERTDVRVQWKQAYKNRFAEPTFVR